MKPMDIPSQCPKCGKEKKEFVKKRMKEVKIKICTAEMKYIMVIVRHIKPSPNSPFSKTKCSPEAEGPIPITAKPRYEEDQ